MSPVTPAAAEEQVADMTEHATDHATEHSAEADLDGQVEEALTKMESGELPPMQAILAIKEIADNNPGHVKSNFTLGVMSMQTGQYDKAVERFETVLESDPENGQVWKFLADAQLRLGDTALAKENFAKAIELVDESTAEAFKEELPQLESIN